jgi:hypothetical protein
MHRDVCNINRSGGILPKELSKSIYVVMGNRRAVDYLSEVQRCMGRMRGNSYPSGNILSINLELFR